jgi:hypothetical protein
MNRLQGPLSAGERTFPVARVTLFAAVCLYCAVFLITYRYVLSPQFGYFGTGFDVNLGVEYWLLILLLILVPGSWLPARIDQPSTFLLLVLYFIVYVPAIVLAFHGSRPVLAPHTSMALATLLFVGFSTIQAAQWFVPRVVLPRPKTAGVAFWVAWLCLAGVCAGYLVITLGGSARILSLADVYLQRGIVASMVETSGARFLGYAFAWMNGVILPVVFAFGVFARKRLVCVLAILMYVGLFFMWGGKASLFAPLALIGLTMVLRAADKHVASVIAICLCLLLLSPLVVVGDSPLLVLGREWMIALIHQRTFTSSALLITQYLDFFDLHPFTLGSHITGVDQFVSYPYERDVPRTIGLYYYGGPVTANVNFWAQDGLASLGLPGILLMSVICAAVFWLLDVAAQHLDARFTTLSLAYTATNFADTGLFTTLVSGGLLLLIITFWHIRWAPLARKSHGHD